jgi:hypothetical protein
MADLSVGRVAAVAQCIDHRVLEVRASPPSDEAIGIAAPTLFLQKWRDRLPQAFLHVDNGAVLIEDQHLDLALEDVRAFHALALMLWRWRAPIGLQPSAPAAGSSAALAASPTWRIRRL